MEEEAESTTDNEESNYSTTSMTTLSESDLIKIEFYKTYDVMTGIRIAATLGGFSSEHRVNLNVAKAIFLGFFSMMILLVLYKNYCKPSKSLSEEKLNAAVTAALEEEDRALKAALEATSFYSSLGKGRLSVSSGNTCFNPAGGRISSIFGSESERRDDVEVHGECERLNQDYFGSNLLNIPDRRLSTATCSSGDTSYLERRGSSFDMGINPPPCCHKLEKFEKRKLPANEDTWAYPIDIQVIQPTPKTSPTTSEQTLYDERGLQVPNVDNRHRLTVERSDLGLAPLASISSLGSFSSTSSPYLSSRRPQKEDHFTKDQNDSLGSDSVFVEDIDTEDEVDGFSTDSFDDDYSFCEDRQRPASRCERKLQFASLDSYDAADSQTETIVEQPKRKLFKTNSEPKRKQVERVRAKRQLSMPLKSKTAEETSIIRLPLPCSSSSMRQETIQGTFKDLPSSEKRARFQKQKTILEGFHEADVPRLERKTTEQETDPSVLPS